MALISILHPSRSRPQKSFQTIKKWVDRCGIKSGLEVIISLDIDDNSMPEYFKYFGTSNFEHKVIANENRSAVDAINWAASKSSGNILIVVSDDTDCPDDWAKKIIETTSGMTDWIAKCPDGIQKWIITMPVLDRRYYNRFGYVYHPDYLHMFCDTELTCVADLTGRKIHLNINFPHNHYSVSKGNKDEVSARADKTWSQGESTFIRRYKLNFGLSNPVGKIESPEYLNWIKSKS